MNESAKDFENFMEQKSMTSSKYHLEESQDEKLQTISDEKSSFSPIEALVKDQNYPSKLLESRDSFSASPETFFCPKHGHNLRREIDLIAIEYVCSICSITAAFEKGEKRNDDLFSDPEQVITDCLSFGKEQSKRLKNAKKILDKHQERYQKDRYSNLYYIINMPFDSSEIVSMCDNLKNELTNCNIMMDNLFNA